ncbi:glycolate oxidase FAD binding subunit [Haloactinopolyspora alba]|uniref:Glycolate oxidase FAD binding subunit n=1 Tax=Haloactinopolyspora alba TaxID=648780 RepID=A0A2P8DZW4_9ACTN|nr:FAD-binding oxidoreductase [Haloactinopolyspora alba]PSL02761.1 glycolate oxidase FAD binding subunit [Haloactinopolyspora alba]
MTSTRSASPVAAAAVHRPGDLAAARDAVLAAREADANILVHGAGTKLGWGGRPAPGRNWHVVDTRGLNRLVRHDAGDMTASVQAGMPLRELQAQLAHAGQELAADPSRRARGATVGGVYAAGDGGPRRHHHGGVRDLVIGTTAVLADGTVARSGGDVIKNVAGYDLGKLWSGSLGTLGLVVEMTVRLHPLAEAARAVRVPAAADVATAIVLDLLASPAEPVAVEWSGGAGGGALLVGVEGRAAAVDAQVASVAAVARRHAATVEPVDGEPDVWDAWREAHAGEPGATVARAATRPGDLAAAADALDVAADGTSVGTTLHSHAGLGLHDAVLRGGDAAEHAAVAAAWRERIRAIGGSVVLRDRPAGVDEHVDPWGDPGSGRLLELMRSVKSALDPERRFAPGRFVGGI